MSNISSVYVGDVGTAIRIYIDNPDIQFSDITLAKILCKKPNGTIVEWTCEKTTDNDGNDVLQYITVDGDFDTEGVYKCQVYIETNDWKGRSSPFIIKVENLFSM